MKSLFALVVFVILPFEVFLEDGLDEYEEETIKLVTNFGYPFEKHRVETEDGYILTVYRIPHGKNGNQTNQWPILLNHGMLGTAENFILLKPSQALGYYLADKGYDVWMMNSRGTRHSRLHKTLTSDQKEFWNFSWHEIGVYDIPAVIDYILNTTDQTSLFYGGHSQGCTTLFVMGSERPEYNNKIKLMIGLAPGAIYKNLKHDGLLWSAKNYKLLKSVADMLNIFYLPPPFFKENVVRDLIKLFCGEDSALKKTCHQLLLLITEVNPENVDANELMSMVPLGISTISVNQAFHYAQLIRSGTFQKYDWGPSVNLQKYGTKTPPLYNLKNVTFPVALFYGEKDQLVSPQDVQLLAQQLPNVAVTYKVPMAYFTHLEFIIAKNARALMYQQILKALDNYKNK